MEKEVLSIQSEFVKSKWRFTEHLRGDKITIPGR
jgi:hypothetical protein